MGGVIIIYKIFLNTKTAESNSSPSAENIRKQAKETDLGYYLPSGTSFSTPPM